MPETEPNYKIISNPSQVKKPKPPRKEIVVLDDVETEDGSPAAFLVYQMTAREVGRYQKSLRKYDEAGNVIGEDFDDRDIKLLSFAIRDNKGNRLWNTPKEAVDFLGDYDQASITKLMVGYNKANNPKSAEVVEGNSERTPTGS